MDWTTLFSQRSKNGESLEPLLKTLGFKKTFLIFNVVGTNGKGSVSNYLAQGFRQKYAKVGLFTSPHLQRPNERIQINDEPISDAAFWNLYQRAATKIDLTTLNFFSVVYLIAMWYFYEKGCDLVILEAGIGGNKDATKTIAGDYGVVTNIALDHTELLGQTTQAIVHDKAGIINASMHFFIPTSLDLQLRLIFQNRASQTSLIDNLANTYRERNVKLAQGILSFFKINTEQGFITPKGRTQKLAVQGNELILDVGHNYDGIESALILLERQKQEFEQVVLMLRRSKSATNIASLFKNRSLFVYASGKEFYTAAELGGTPLLDLATFLASVQPPTLYIGSFSLIGQVLDYYADVK